MRRWLENYGFAFLVLAALISASYQAATVTVPDPAPDFALRAEQIYRLEVGAAFFVVFYLVAMALILALSGRGFAEFGTRGLRIEEVVVRKGTKRQQAALSRQRKVDRQMQAKLEHVVAAVDCVEERLMSQERRLERLEERP